MLLVDLMLLLRRAKHNQQYLYCHVMSNNECCKVELMMQCCVSQEFIPSAPLK